MSDHLPPSRFGAGYTYGGAGSTPPAPPAPAPQLQSPATYPPMPTAAPPIDPFGQSAPAYPSSPPPSYGMPQPQYPNGYAPAVAASGGTAATAAVLSFLGALWQGFAAYGVVVAIVEFNQFAAWKAMTSALPAWMSAWLIGSTLAQILVPLLLLIGGIQLASRRLTGRGTIAAGCVLLLVAKSLDAMALFGLGSWFSSVAGSYGSAWTSSEVLGPLAKAGMMVVILPAGLAVLTLIFAYAGLTKRWCLSAPIRP